MKRVKAMLIGPLKITTRHVHEYRNAALRKLRLVNFGLRELVQSIARITN